MDTGQTERITGYLGERSVERFYLQRGINARVVEFEAFDILIILKNGRTLKCQVKTTTQEKFTVASGRSRAEEYTTVDFFALVKLADDGRDDIYFVVPEDLTSKSVTISRLSSRERHEAGWNRIKKLMEVDSGT